ncbi:MAG: PDZ domain-containing protein [Aeromicrobium sp.]|uniref:YlbL family protein n=1 Tax=Aeromicrobium sp. TaxID=1871063 RepID=UPI0039E21DAC
MSETPPPSTHAPTDAADEPQSDPKASDRYLTVAVAAVTSIVLAGVAMLLPVPYATMQPGPVFDTLGEFDDQPMLSIEGAELYPTDGTLDFTTVSVTSPEGSVSFVEALWAYADDDVNLVPRDFLYPDDETAEESDAVSAAQLASSKDNSAVAALRALGYEVPEQVVVSGVDEEGASAEVLQDGDVLRSVDGTPVDAPQEAVDVIGALTPGDEVTLAITRDDAAQQVVVTTRPDEDDPDKPRIGVGLSSSFDLPVSVTNNVGDSIGGPSAGTMFALAIYDLLTPGSLTGGHRVAGTGEISPDGVVGPIGGVRQKMAGASADDIEIFLVPAENCAEAVQGDDFGMTLVRVETLDDAIAALEALAEDADAPVETCS